jgi:hypothetical protein
MTAGELVDRAGEAAQRSAAGLGPAGDAARDSFRAPGSGHENLLSRFFGWLGERTGSLFPDVGLGGSVTSLLGWLIVGGLATGLILLAIRAAARARVPRRPPGHPAEPRPPGFERARRHAIGLAEGDPREALRLLYAALLLEVGRRRGWRALPGRTNWTFVRRLGPATPQGAALGECTRLFEGRVYGDTPAAAADVSRMDGLVEEVLA